MRASENSDIHKKGTTHMKIAGTLLLVLALTLSLTACAAGADGTPTVSPTSPSTPATQTPSAQTPATAPGLTEVSVVTSDDVDVIDWDSEDLDAGWDSAAATFIELDGDSISVDGSGATVDGATVTITSGGAYVVSGTLDDGQVRVDTTDVETVKLVLNGADITCSSSAPIYVVNADRTVIILADDTENRVTDGSVYVFEDAETTEPNAAVFSHDDLTITGGGSLAVQANYDNGIQSKDDLVITGGVISVNAVSDGIKGKDSLAVRDADITVVAGADGLQASNDADEGKGWVYIESGSIDIDAGLDGIQAETSLVIAGGTLVVTSGGGSANSSDRAGEPGNTWGRWESARPNTTDTSESAKGLKAGVTLAVVGGSITIDSSDDALHSNGGMLISGGDVTAASGDDGIHADTSINILAGDITISQSYEGIESAAIIIGGGSLHVVASDDGINVSGGADGSSMMGRPGQNSFSSSGNYLQLNGGRVVVDAQGDGIDVNGSVTMTGGVVIVSGPTSSMNGALDYLGGFTVSGGFLVAAGSTGMAQAPDTASSQNSVMVNLSSSMPEGTMFRIETEGGEEVLTFVPARAYQSVVLSSPSLMDGETCVVYTGGASTGTVADGLYSGGDYTPGAEVGSFTVSGPVTRFGSAGGMQQGGGFQPGGGTQPGGGMRPGGTRP
jgi:hypothetical protein